MSTLNTITLREFVDNVAPVVWNKTVASIPMDMKNSGIFMTDTWDSGTGDTRTFREVDREEYASVIDEDDDATQAKVQIGYEKTTSPISFGKDMKITYQMRRRNQYQEVLNDLTNLAQITWNKLELDLAHRITFGTATSYTDKDGRSIDISTGDGLALFSTAHTLAGSSSTYRSRLAGNPQVSKSALEAMEKLAVEETLNHFGELKYVEYDVLFTSRDPNTVNTVRELLQATAEVSAPNNGIPNVYKAKYRHVVIGRLATTAAGHPDSTKTKYWGIVSTQHSNAYLSIEEEPHLITPTTDTDNSSRTWTFQGRGSWAICVVSGMGWKFSSGDGAA